MSANPSLQLPGRPSRDRAPNRSAVRLRRPVLATLRTMFARAGDRRRGPQLSSTVRRLDLLMHPHEEQIVRTFFRAAKRERFLALLAGARRPKALDSLNHLWDLDPRYTSPLPANAGVLNVLRSKGAPDSCYILSDTRELDGKEMPLAAALEAVESGGWGSIIGCIPSRLAYYFGEMGEQRLVLERRPT